MKEKLLILTLLAILVITASCRKSEGGMSVQAEDTAYTITRISDKADWNTIPVMPIDKVLWTEDSGVRAEGQLCYDDDNLYVHMHADERDIRAENTEPLSPVYQDSCLEFFFKLKDSNNYFNFEINPNGCLCLQFGPDRNDRIDIVRRDAAEYFDIKTARTDKGWEVYYRIPLRFMQLFYPDYSFEGDLLANMYKCGDKTVRKHYLSWSLIDLENPDFHCPEFFGTISFEK